MFYVAMIILVGLILYPFVVAKSKKYSSKKGLRSLSINLISFFAICLIIIAFPFTVSAAEATTTVAKYGDLATGLGFISAAVVMAVATLAAGFAIASAASAAAGATSENPKLFGKVIVFVVLGEGIPVFALIVSILILNKL